MTKNTGGCHSSFAGISRPAQLKALDVFDATENEFFSP